MSKKSKRKSNLRLSILLLILLLILLISSTYAWFTANKVVTVSTLDVNIAAKNGLQISTDAETWKSRIENLDITTGAYKNNINQLPGSMEPVSTVGEIDTNTGHMLMYYGAVAPDDTEGGREELTAKLETDAAGTEGKYIAFDMFLKVNAKTNLKMTQGSNVVVKENGADLGIKQASRVAFCVEGTADAGAALTDITGMKDAKSFLDAEKSVYIWEPNPNWHTAAAVAHASNPYGVTTTTGKTEADIVTCYGIKRVIGTYGTDDELIPGTGIPLTETYKESDDFAAIVPDYKEISDDNCMMPETPIFSLEPGITKVRVYMWIEGQDVDCENTASGTDISFNLQLAVDDGTTTVDPS